MTASTLVVSLLHLNGWAVALLEGLLVVQLLGITQFDWINILIQIVNVYQWRHSYFKTVKPCIFSEGSTHQKNQFSRRSSVRSPVSITVYVRQFYRVRFHVTSWLQLVLWIFKFSVVSVFGWKFHEYNNIETLYMTFDSLSKHLCLICLSAVSCWMSERKSVQVFLVRKHCRDERSVASAIVNFWKGFV